MLDTILLHMDGQKLLFPCLLKRMQNNRNNLLTSVEFLSIALTVAQSELHHASRFATHSNFCS